jgi:NAD(P)-dependent dehydrogenase (short-subunit alcohol dehydrogenase family)
MRILITGGTNGMGKGLGKILASLDDGSHELIILCRSLAAGEKLREELRSQYRYELLSLVRCDLAILADVSRAIQEIKERFDFLDAVFINAGLGYAPRREVTADGMDPHFQVNYLSQFMLTLNLLELVEKSQMGGRVIFNVTESGEIFWDDIHMERKWGFEAGIHQAMAAKRMFLSMLDRLYKARNLSSVSFVGFQISKTVWSNQINIIPGFMKFMASLMRMLGSFISIEESGRIMAPLFLEAGEESRRRSGKFITWKKGEFCELKEDAHILDPAQQERLWNLSLDFCGDEITNKIAGKFSRI